MKKSLKFIILTAAFTALLTLSSCGGAEEVDGHVTTGATKGEVRAMVDDFFGPVYTADPVTMITYMDDEQDEIFTRNGDRMHISSSSMESEYYLFIEDGKKYIISDGEKAYEDEAAYDSYAEDIASTVDYLIKGFLSGEDDPGDETKYSAIRTDKDEENGTRTELAVTVEGTQDGETMTVTIIGNSLNGAVEDAIVTVDVGDDRTEDKMEFTYDGISVDLPDYVISERTKWIYTEVESPFDTLDEVIETINDEDGFPYAAMGDSVYCLASEDGRHYQLKAEISDEDLDAVMELDIFSNDYSDKLYDILGKLEVSQCLDFTDSVIPEEELKGYVGSTAKDVLDDGFEGSGWSVLDGNATLDFEKDLIVYRAVVTLPAGFDESSEFGFEDLEDTVIEEFHFSEISPAAMPIG